MSEELPEVAPAATSNYVKGISFEREFMEYMKNKLGFGEVLHRKRAKTTLDWPLEIDMTWISFIYSAIALGLALFGGIVFARGKASLSHWLRANIDASLGELLHPLLLTHGFFLLMCVGAMAFFIMAFTAATQESCTVWVECRNWKTKVDSKYVFEVNGKANRGRKHRPSDEVWIVSRSGFKDDALSAANECKIYCVKFCDSSAAVENGLPSRAI